MGIEATCAIAGGGPAGLVLGYLLARAGVPVVVIEKHADFLRDFRGDTIHPSTMQLMADLGELDAFLKLPHSAFRQMSFDFEGDEVVVADFSTLDVPAPYVAMMPQWDFLDFLADRGREFPGFRLMMQTEATGLIEEGGRVVGLRARGPEGGIEIRAGLVVAADGRHSAMREAAGLAVTELAAPIDVLWFRLSRQTGDPPESLGRMRKGRIFVMLNRGDYWQCAHVVPKGGAEAVKARGLPAFRAMLDECLQIGRGHEIESWDQVKLLSVQVNRVGKWWREGLLVIGDAAHAMSPLGGIGVNVAIQDAVAAANLLAAKLAAGEVSGADLAAVQARREGPVRIMQRAQVLAQNRVILPVLEGKQKAMPLPFRLIGWFPPLRRVTARFIGLGVQSERLAPEIARCR